MVFPLEDKRDYETQEQIELILNSYVRTGLCSWTYHMEIRNGKLYFSSKSVKKYRQTFIFHKDFKTHVNLILFYTENINCSQLKSCIKALHQITPFNDGYYIISDILTESFLLNGEHEYLKQLNFTLLELKSHGIQLYTTSHSLFYKYNNDILKFNMLPIAENDNQDTVKLMLPDNIENKDMKNSILLNVLTSQLSVLLADKRIYNISVPVSALELIDILSAVTNDQDPDIEELRLENTGELVFFEPNVLIDLKRSFSDNGLFAEYADFYKRLCACVQIWLSHEQQYSFTFNVVSAGTQKLPTSYSELAEAIRKFGSILGTASAINAYYNGVPLADIE